MKILEEEDEVPKSGLLSLPFMYNNGPRTWRVYTRKRKGTCGNQQIEEAFAHSVNSVAAVARCEKVVEGTRERHSKVSSLVRSAGYHGDPRLQARVEANESLLVNFKNQIQNLVQSLTSMQESLTKEKHEQEEFRNLIVKFMRERVKRPSDEDDGAETENSHGSRIEFRSDTHLVAKRVELSPFEGDVMLLLKL
ncbi:hypothetical protein SESBI_29514 [Sesbania bispinosa]|nr:hypothetical protein SESBI_29514 [Sesbania bispinosa]